MQSASLLCCLRCNLVHVKPRDNQEERLHSPSQLVQPLKLYLPYCKTITRSRLSPQKQGGRN